MRTVLAISDSVENSEFDLNRSIKTIKDYGLDPLAVVPKIIFADGKQESNDVTEMLDYVFDECDTAAVSVGYITEPEVISYLAGKLMSKTTLPLVAAPSIISDNGTILVSEETYNVIRSDLLPKVRFIMLNSYEAELLSGIECPQKEDFHRASKKIFNVYGCHVLIKGNSVTEGKALLFDGKTLTWLDKPQVRPGFDPRQYMLLTAVACSLAYDHTTALAARLGLEFCSGRTDLDWITGEKKVEKKVNLTKADYKAPPVPSLSKNTPVARTSIAINSSLVSPGKSIRDIAREYPLEPQIMKPAPKEKPALTSAIEAPKPEVTDITTPSARFDREVGNSIKELQSLRDRLNRLNRLAGSGE